MTEKEKKSRYSHVNKEEKKGLWKAILWRHYVKQNQEKDDLKKIDIIFQHKIDNKKGTIGEKISWVMPCLKM